MMRQALALSLVISMIAIGIPPLPAQAAGAAGEITGVARDLSGVTLASQSVRLRSLITGEPLAAVTTNTIGQFTFEGLSSGSYFVELLDSRGLVVGTTAPITLATGTMFARVAVTATALQQAPTDDDDSIFKEPLFWAFVGAAAGIVAILIAKKEEKEASPSR